MIPTHIRVDLQESPENQPVPLHNRWHPDIPPVCKVKCGEPFRIECIDWTGGQVGDNDSTSDVRDIDLSQVHYVSGPIEVEGAEAGDLLVVDILNLGYLADSPWGFTGIFAKENGGGFLTDQFPEAAKAIWDLEGVYASSRHIPHVKLTGYIHPGLIGTAPSKELLETWNRRERALFDSDPGRIPPLCYLPCSHGALCGITGPGKAQEVKDEGARTVPPRENGGNCDIKNLSRGSRGFFPVYVKGANLSIGDIHFSQGDGEISFCGAIEMAGWIELKVHLIKGGMEKHALYSPAFIPGLLNPQYSEFMIFEGISVDEAGKQHYLDAHLSYKNACLAAVEYLQKLGYTGEQAYLLLSCAPCEGRISGIVDIPNACCTLALPTQIFDFPVQPRIDEA